MQSIVAVDLVRQLRSALGRLSELAAAEDPKVVIEGKKRSAIQAPRGLDASFDGARARARERAAGGAVDVTETAPHPPAPAPGPASTGSEADDAIGGLLELLRGTESSLAAAGFDAEAVEFVFDDDQRRVAEARKR
jgi:hypothetical protein